MSRTRILTLVPVVALTLLAFGGRTAQADSSELWVARHNGPANGNDTAKAVATDAGGNVFVTGLEYGSPNRDDTVTRKYAPDGTLLWERRDGTILDEHGISIAVDRNGDVFVLDIKLAVRKYAGATGELLWEVPGDGLAVFGHMLALDSKGDVVVIGNRYDDLAVRKYRSTDGTQAWSARFDGYQLNDSPDGVAIGPDDTVYVAETSTEDPGRSHVITQAYTADGRRLWSRTDSATNGDGVGIVVDGDRNSYTASVTWNRGMRDYKLVKRDPDGEEQWIRYYDSGPDTSIYGLRTDIPRDVAIDSRGNVTVFGEVFDPSSLTQKGTGWDYATVQWNPEGDIRWTQRFDANGNEFAEAVATDGHDNVYVTGGARLNGRQDEDMVTVKYDPEGNQVWTHRYSGGVGDDTPKGLTATDDGVYVVGFSRGQGTFYDYVTVAIPNS